MRFDPLKILTVAVFMILPAAAVKAQSPAEMPIAPSTATKVPLTDPARQQPSVSVERNNSTGSTSNLSTNSNSVSVQGPYSGSAPQGRNNGGVLSLTLAEALARGLQSNLGAIENTQQVAQADAQCKIARSALRPNLNTVITEEVERLNLRSAGVLSPSFR